VLRCLKPLVRRSQPTGDVKLGKSCVTVCHIEKPEAIRDRKPGSEMQVQSLVTDDVEERVRPKRRRDREAREVSSVYRDVSRPPILGNKVSEYEDPARWDGPNELVIGHDTTVKVNETPLGNVGYGWIRHTSLSWRRMRRNGMRDSAAPIYTRAKKIPLCPANSSANPGKSKTNTFSFFAIRTNPNGKHIFTVKTHTVFSGYSPVSSGFIWTISGFIGFSTEIRLDIIRRMPEITHQACYCTNGSQARCPLWHLPQPDGNHTRAGRFPGSGEMRPLFTRSISNQ
jgi:hypothetical protein